MFGSDDKEKRYTLYRDPEFRSVLWDRRMFAYDVTYITPALLESTDAWRAHAPELILHGIMLADPADFMNPDSFKTLAENTGLY